MTEELESRLQAESSTRISPVMDLVCMLIPPKGGTPTLAEIDQTRSNHFPHRPPTAAARSTLQGAESPLVGPKANSAPGRNGVRRNGVSVHFLTDGNCLPTIYRASSTNRSTTASRLARQSRLRRASRPSRVALERLSLTSSLPSSGRVRPAQARRRTMLDLPTPRQ